MNLLIVACHLNTDFKKRCFINNFPYLQELCENIAIINSSEAYDSNIFASYKDKVLSFTHIPNDKYLGYGKWLSYILNNDVSLYQNVILINDSVIITRSLNDYKALIKPDVDLVALLDSYQTSYHYPDYLRSYNQTSLKLYIEYLLKNKNKIISNADTLINTYEVNSTHLFENVSILYKTKTTQPVNIHFENDLISLYLYYLNYPIIKIKKVLENNYIFLNYFKILKPQLIYIFSSLPYPTCDRNRNRNRLMYIR